MDKIRTKKELEKIIKELDDQGFGRIRTSDVIQSKIDHIINKANVHNIHDYNQRELNEKIYKTESFDEMEKIATEFFSKFSSKSKIMEYINKFRLVETDSCAKPSKYDYERGDYSLTKWEEFKKKWNIPDLGTYYQKTYIYDLTKNYIKIQFPRFGSWEFEELYKALFKEKPLPFDERKVGIHNLGKIELKVYANGNYDIKGPGLDAYKKLYKEKISQETHSNNVIFYGSDKIIIEAEPGRD